MFFSFSFFFYNNCIDPKLYFLKREGLGSDTICLDRYIGRYISVFLWFGANLRKCHPRFTVYLDVSGGALVICLLSGSAAAAWGELRVSVRFEWLGFLMTKMPLCLSDTCLPLVEL